MATNDSHFVSWFARLTSAPRALIVAVLPALLTACGESSPNSSSRAKPGAVVEAACEARAAGELSSLTRIGCKADFDTLAALPLDVTIPGVRTVKFVIDRFDQSDGSTGKLYFQNSQRYAVHFDFVKANIKRTFDASNFSRNYYGTDDTREFYLGSIAYYESSGTWALELAPYDTASAPMIEKMFDVITNAKAYFKPALAFHPTSETQLALLETLDHRIPVVTTDELYAASSYQPLTKATAMGVLTFRTASDLAAGEFLPYYSIVVLDQAPNDIGVVAGIVTEQFQSSLSHVNVLSTNRATPNMGLRNALSNPTLRQYEEQWVELKVAADDWSVRPVSAEEGRAFYDAHKPKPVTLPAMNLEVRALQDVRDIIPGYLALNDDPTNTRTELRAELLGAVRSYGGKTANYAVLAQVEGLPVPRAFGIPMYYYDVFMRENGFYERVRGYLENRDVLTGEAIDFTNDPRVRQRALSELRSAMLQGAVDAELQASLRARLARDYVSPTGIPTKMRFRTSTNSEDLDAFPCAGCYESHTGNPANWEDVLDAIRETYSSAWLFRTFEERSYYGVAHESVGMALLVHGHFPNETANGVAITANPYDATQSNAEAYYVNVAYGGDAEVVHLPAGVTTDQFLYYVGASGNNVAYISRSNQPLPSGRSNVLTNSEIGDLVRALTSVQNVFRKAYGTDSWYAMDVEFKFAPQDEWGLKTNSSTLWVKQARPYPNPND